MENFLAMRKYGKLLIEGVEHAEQFTVVSVPRSNLKTIVTEASEPITDGSGQTEPVPLRWANYIIVEHDEWDETHTAIIENAVAAYNAKYPEFPIPAQTELIW
jgi:hypothetical protein